MHGKSRPVPGLRAEYKKGAVRLVAMAKVIPRRLTEALKNMRRRAYLFQEIVSFENLLAASKEARKGKRLKPEPALFHLDLETNILELQEDLATGAYRPGTYHTFRIYDPKSRVISAAPYRDRVVHHAICRVIEPIFDRCFIFDSYANRKKKGTHKALDRCTSFCRSSRYVLKSDVKKFFPSIDHEVLLNLLAKKIKCKKTMDLLWTVISASNPQEPAIHYFPGDDLFTPLLRRRGIPIGNLTSQFFGNVMLDPLDHFMKETMHCRRYVRFSDDFLVFGDEKAMLHELLEKTREFLYLFRLALHDKKCVVRRVSDGVPFLGWHVFSDHRRLRRSTGIRIQRSLRRLAKTYQEGGIDLKRVKASVMSFIGHLKHGDTRGLRQEMFRNTVFKRIIKG